MMKKIFLYVVGGNDVNNLEYGFHVDETCNSKNITHIDLRDYDTSNVSDMSYMFTQFNVQSLDCSNFNTSNVITMLGMFCGCKKLECINLNKFNLKNVIHCRNLFDGCISLKKIRCTREFKEWCLRNQRRIALEISSDFKWDLID